MFYSVWAENDSYVYLGSEVNPHTGQKYDFWFANGKSAVARHGNQSCEYGSCRLEQFNYVTQADHATDDLIWGMNRAVYLSLFYTTFSKRPLLGR